MSVKLLICAPGRPALNGHKRRSFLWTPEFNCFVYEGRQLTEQEFNTISEPVFKKNGDLRPFVKIAQFSDGKAAVDTQFMVPATEHEALKTRYKALQARIGEPVAPVATITAGREITLDEALAVVLRLAPEKLRKQSQGRVAAPKEMQVG